MGLGIRTWLSGIGGVLLAVSLMGCGKDVCVAGIGKCDFFGKHNKNPVDVQSSNGGSAPTGLQTPAIGCKSWGQCWLRSGQTLELMAVGGAPPYEFHVVEIPGIGKVGEIRNGRQYFVQPVNMKLKARIRVTDQRTKLTDPCELCEAEVTILPNTTSALDAPSAPAPAPAPAPAAPRTTPR